MSIDETAVSKDELYTIITNKDAHGGKGALIAILEGIKASSINLCLAKIPEGLRNTVTEVTVDMSVPMEAIIRESFPKATIVTDRFHVQQLITEAAQEIRLIARRETLKEESKAILLAKKENKIYTPTVYENGDTKNSSLAGATTFYLNQKLIGRKGKKPEPIFYLNNFHKCNTLTIFP